MTQLFLVYVLLKVQLASATPPEKSTHLPRQNKVKKGESIVIQPSHQDPHASLVQPKIPEQSRFSSKQLTYFKFFEEKGQLFLKFMSQDLSLHLSHTRPIVIDLMPRPPLRLEPTLILKTDWPKNSNQIPIKISGTENHETYFISGRATYSYCDQKTGVCTKTTSNLFYELRR